VEQAEYKACSICGLKVKIPETFNAPRGRCPRCGELISNPHWHPIQKQRTKLKIWSMENWKKSISRLIAKLEPKFDELSVFFIGVAFTLTFLVNIPQIVNWYKNIGLFLAVTLTAYIILTPLSGIPFVSGIVSFASGLFYSLHHIFDKKVTKPNEKKLMAFFAVTTNFLSGIAVAFYTAVEAFELKKTWLYVFPVWTIVNSFLLILKCRSIDKNEEVIAEENASLGEIIIGLVVLMAVFGICHYGFDIRWPFTLSICVVYATNLSKAFEDVFLGKKRLEQPAGANK
jgi:DNA-directed RNA polymerase subunit RPC12/RpoP